MINLAREGFGKNNGVLKRNNNKIIIADVPDVAATTMLVSTNASHDRIPRGIRDPTESVSKRKLFDEQLKEFHEELTVLPDGRYECGLFLSLPLFKNHERTEDTHLVNLRTFPKQTPMN
ncbi:hypothetical protein TNIN_414501 [Trichonephila inaurata madagascariensis]|uniref:Uncharacterized protein n=1 Tax=Trichonephila inaurata madagascariensis TaxID=2747483 RepID=A0A8X6KAW5_9ARAC|nr:hypothetical protein TNIN_414501 [Trichonephila inaurata madagascariensis]